MITNVLCAEEDDHSAKQIRSPKQISTTKAAEILGVSERHIRRLCKGKTLKGVKLGGTWYVDRASVLAFDESLTHGKLGQQMSDLDAAMLRVEDLKPFVSPSEADDIFHLRHGTMSQAFKNGEVEGYYWAKGAYISTKSALEWNKKYRRPRE